MALEQYFNKEKINIKGLTVDIPKGKEFPRTRQLYDRIKETKLFGGDERFDKTKPWKDYMLWNYGLYHKGERLSNADNRYFIEQQLLGVVVEGIFDKNSSQKLYGKLKETPFYDADNGNWLRSVDKGSHNKLDDDLLCENQLLGIFAEAQFDKESAKMRYEKIKNDPMFFNKKVSEWRNPERFGGRAISQLLGILAESIFNNNSAKEDFEMLQKSQFYDSENERWKMCGDYPVTSCHGVWSENELASILIESQFDQESAKKRYEQLKKTEVYDSENGMWLCGGGQYEQDRKSWRSFDQLLGVLIEYAFEKNDSMNFPEKESVLPESRKF